MNEKHCCPHDGTAEGRTGLQRRQFLQIAALGAGATLLASAAGGRNARAAGHAGTLLLTCMDYRLMDEIERYMLRRGLYHNYDHIVLAGASLGAITDKYPAWSRTFWDHLDLAVKLHEIRTVMVIDHRDCGAYRLLLGEDYSKDKGRETAEHAMRLTQLKDLINGKYPSIEVETLLMSLDGDVETVQNIAEQLEKTHS